MKAFRMLYVGMLSILALASCIDNDDNSEWYGSEGVVFTTAIQSRVSGNAWNANDEVGVYMMSTGSSIDAATAKNKKYLAQSNGTLVAAPDNGIYLPESGAVDFIAYYPYTASLNGNKIAVNIADQSNPALIDLLYSNGTKGVKAEDGNTIALTFIHQLTKITLNVAKDATIESLIDLKVKLKGIVTEGEFNLADGVLTAASGRDSEEIAMLVDTDGNTATVTAIIFPTASGSGATPINLIFELGGKLFTYTIDDASIFEKGTNVSFNAELSINNGKPVVTVGEATITDWTEKPGGDINVDFDGETQPGEETVILDEPFAEGQGAFTIDDKQLPEGGTFVWQHDAKYKYMKASAHIDEVDKASESWLISPELDLTTVTMATLTFMHAINYAGDMANEQTLWVTEAGTQDWTQVTIPTYPAGDSWDKVSSGDIDLSAYAGKKIQFAFKYVSTTSAAATWEVYNVKVVANGEGGGDVDPDPEPGEEKTFFTETMTNGGAEASKVAIASFTGWDNTNLNFTDETGNADVRSIAHKTEGNTGETTKVNNVWFPSGKDSKLTISGFNTIGYKKFKLSYEAAANVFNIGSSIDLNVLKVSFNNQSVTIPSKVVSKDNNEANVFFLIEVTFEVDGSTNSTLEFFAGASENTMGLRAYNITLVGLLE